MRELVFLYMKAGKGFEGTVETMHPGVGNLEFHSIGELAMKLLKLAKDKEADLPESRVWRVLHGKKADKAPDYLLKYGSGSRVLCGEITDLKTERNLYFSSLRALYRIVNRKAEIITEEAEPKVSGLAHVSLMEYISIFSGCDNLSDFERGQYTTYLKQTLEEICPEDFRMEEWMAVARQIEGDKATAAVKSMNSCENIKSHILQYL